MTKESKIALLGFPIGFGLFFLLQRNVFSKQGIGANSLKKNSQATDKQMQEAASAYADAVSSGEDSSVLNALNVLNASEYNIQVQQQKSDGQIIVTDMAGNKIATYQPQT